MGLGDKIANQAEELKGKAKVAIGKVFGNEQMQVEGRAEQLKAGAKKVGEKLKDAGKNIRDTLR